jgi:DNA (cytosine-5)-methyltransferase 1
VVGGHAVPVLLDAFSGAGGAARGFRDAGFDKIVGIDIRPQPRYPYEFIQADAMGLLRDAAFLRQFDAIHCSPPCQLYSPTRYLAQGKGNPDDWLFEVLDIARDWTVPYSIENVEAAQMGKTYHVCGSMFPELSVRGGTRQLRRHRQFKVNFEIPTFYCRHNGLKAIGLFGDLGGYGPPPSYTECPKTLDEAQQLMGIYWMTYNEMKEAIPPAYTRHVGQYMLKAIA